MPTRDIVVIGGSAGAVEGVIALARALDLPGDVSLFICIHVPASGGSVLPRLLTRACACPARHPRDHEPIRPGTIYVAPPDRHLVLKGGEMRVVVGPKENGHRPAIDPLFRSAARAYGARVVGVVLSGNLDDGSVGLRTVLAAGGVAIVQDPDEAMYPAMPANALAATLGAAESLTLAEIAARIRELVGAEVSVEEESIMEGERMPDEPEDGRDIVEASDGEVQRLTKTGTPSGFTCPECHGALWEMPDPTVLRFRCRTGHAFTSETLREEQGRGLEAALWTALRAIEENASLVGRLLARAADNGHSLAADRFGRQIRSLESQAQTIRAALDDGWPVAIPHAGVADLPEVVAAPRAGPPVLGDR